jgi:hypothetical protein
VDIPAVVRNKALAAGAAGWLDDLPRLIASLDQRNVLEAGADVKLGFKLVDPGDVADQIPDQLGRGRDMDGHGAFHQMSISPGRHAPGEPCIASRYIGLRYSEWHYRVRRHNHTRARKGTDGGEQRDRQAGPMG